jgi:hypothetical protein
MTKHQRDKEKKVFDASDQSPGNYLYVVWDALLWVEEETKTAHICQLVAAIPQSGETFRCYIKPEVVIQTANFPYLRVKKGNWCRIQNTSFSFGLIHGQT